MKFVLSKNPEKLMKREILGEWTKGILFDGYVEIYDSDDNVILHADAETLMWNSEFSEDDELKYRLNQTFEFECMTETCNPKGARLVHPSYGVVVNAPIQHIHMRRLDTAKIHLNFFIGG